MTNAPSLDVRRETRPDGVVVLELSGELTVLTRDRLETDAARVVIVARGLDHVDTVGLATLVRLAQECAKRDGRMAIVGLDADILNMRDHLFLDETILFAHDLEDAVVLVSAAP
jgi:anti-anti-sigma factor